MSTIDGIRDSNGNAEIGLVGEVIRLPSPTIEPVPEHARWKISLDSTDAKEYQDLLRYLTSTLAWYIRTKTKSFGLNLKARNGLLALPASERKYVVFIL